jgi:hypothetical protein
MAGRHSAYSEKGGIELIPMSGEKLGLLYLFLLYMVKAQTFLR